MQKRLTKSNDKIIAGVFGGLAEYFGIDITMFRLIATACVIFSGIFGGCILYFIADMIMPDPPKKPDAIDGKFTKK